MFFEWFKSVFPRSNSQLNLLEKRLVGERMRKVRGWRPAGVKEKKVAKVVRKLGNMEEKKSAR